MAVNNIDKDNDIESLLGVTVWVLVQNPVP